MNVVINDIEYSLCHPVQGDIPALKSFWHECYDGDEAFCDFYFEEYFQTERCYILQMDDGTIVCVAHILAGVLADGAESEESDKMEASAAYLYAGGTARQFRKNGCFRQFNMYLNECLLSDGYSAVLFTADDGLEEMYDHMGYTRCAKMRCTQVDAGEMLTNINGNRICYTNESGLRANCSDDMFAYWKCSYESFISLREAYLRGRRNSLLWDDRVMKFMYADFQRDGGIFCIKYKGEQYYAVVTDFEDYIMIRETDFPAEEIDVLVCALNTRFGNKRLVIYSNTDIVYGTHRSEVIYYGHGYLLNEQRSDILKNIYINLIEE